MRKWTIIAVAAIFALGLSAPGWADVEANGNDLVGALGGQAANDAGKNYYTDQTNNSTNTNTQVPISDNFQNNSTNDDHTNNSNQGNTDTDTTVKDFLNNNDLYSHNSATLDDSTNIDVNIENVNVAVSSTDLDSSVSGNSIGSAAAALAGADVSLLTREFDSEREIKSGVSIKTGDNRIDNYTSYGIAGVNLNTGVQSSVQQSINVNPAVGSIQ